MTPCDPTRRGLVAQRAAAALYGVRSGWYARTDLVDALHRGTRIRRGWCEAFLEWCESHDVLRRGGDAAGPLTYVDRARLALGWQGFHPAFHCPTQLDLEPLEVEALTARH